MKFIINSEDLKEEYEAKNWKEIKQIVLDNINIHEINDKGEIID